MQTSGIGSGRVETKWRRQLPAMREMTERFTENAIPALRRIQVLRSVPQSVKKGGDAQSGSPPRLPERHLRESAPLGRCCCRRSHDTTVHRDRIEIIGAESRDLSQFGHRGQIKAVQANARNQIVK